MFKLLYSIFLFLLIPFIFVFAIAHFDNIDKVYSTNDNVQRIQNIKVYDSLDILFMGNSYCYSGIIPEVFDSLNLNTYNLGISTSGVLFYTLIYEDFIKSTINKPKSIFILVSPMSFSSKADNFSFYPIHRYLQQPTSNEQLAFQFNLFDAYPALLKKSFKKGISNLIHKMKPNQLSYFPNDRGFYPSNDENNDSIISSTQNLYKPLSTETIDDEMLSHFNQFVNRIKNDNIEVVVFQLPANQLNNYFSEKYVIDYNIFIKNLKKEFTFIDINLDLSNQYFRNIDHLNTKGAKVCSKELLNRIAVTPELNFLLRNE